MRSVVLCIAGILALAMGPAVASAAPPSANTAAATDVTATTATLKGFVNPNKEETTYYFEYGLTNTYGNRTPDELASGNAGKDVEAKITGLSPGTVYHYRLVATNKDGSDRGDDMTFTTTGAAYTLPPPPGQGPSAVTISAVPTLVTFGRATVIAGQVTGPKNAAVVVDLQSNPYPYTAGFKNTGMTTNTDATGKYSFTVKPAAHTRYQVVAKASPPVTSPAVEVRVRLSVSFKLNDYTARRGQRIKFSGSVRPAHVGRLVRIQRRRSNGTYRTIARTRTRTATAARSSYSKRLRVYRTGTYRVRVSGDADHATGTSRKRRVRVG